MSLQFHPSEAYLVAAAEEYGFLFSVGRRGESRKTPWFADNPRTEKRNPYFAAGVGTLQTDEPQESSPLALSLRERFAAIGSDQRSEVVRV